MPAAIRQFRASLLFSGLAAVLLASPSSAREKVAREARASSVPLFNGRDLKGWTIFLAHKGKSPGVRRTAPKAGHMQYSSSSRSGSTTDVDTHRAS